jgi:hypothetical protein
MPDVNVLAVHADWVATLLDQGDGHATGVATSCLSHAARSSTI